VWYSCIQYSKFCDAGANLQSGGLFWVGGFGYALTIGISWRAEWRVQIQSKQLRKRFVAIFGGQHVTGGERYPRTGNQEFLAPPQGQKAKNGTVTVNPCQFRLPFVMNNGLYVNTKIGSDSRGGWQTVLQEYLYACVLFIHGKL
jgi:hypothetical protein